jgi:uncharacterized protein
MIDSKLAREFVATGRSADCPVIDTHAHYGYFYGIYFPEPLAEAMVATMDRAGVRLAVFSSHMSLLGESDRGNRLSAEVCARYPDRFRCYIAIQPSDPRQIAVEVARAESMAGFIGYKFLADYHAYPITGDAYKPALEQANAKGLPVLLHTWGGSQYDGPALWEELATAYPRVTFLMGHSGFGEWQRAAELARDIPNIILELCAAYSVRGVIDLLCEVAGSEKVTWGTDLPWFEPHYGIGCVLFADISEADRHNILHRNAERIFGL